MGRFIMFSYKLSCRKRPENYYRVYIYVPLENDRMLWNKAFFNGCDEHFTDGFPCDVCKQKAAQLLIAEYASFNE